MFESPTPESTASARVEHAGPVLGLAMIILAISGFLDDSGTVPHSLWLLAAAALLAFGLALAATSIQAIRARPLDSGEP